MSGWRERRQERALAATQSSERALAVLKDVEQFLGTTSKQEDATRRLAELQKIVHLISPARVCPRLPEGTGVAFSMVLVNKATETYEQDTGKLALLKPVLDKIAIAAAINWDERFCGRTDSGADARYYAWRVVGEQTLLDGTVIRRSANKELDLRPDSPMAQALLEECIAKALREFRDGKLKVKDENEAERVGMDRSENRIRAILTHAMRNTESKTYNAYIRSLGLRQTYSPEELDIPFVVARLQWTGETDDPELRRENFRLTREQFMGGRRSFYGTDAKAPATIDVPRGGARVSSPPEDEPAEVPTEPDPPAAPPPNDDDAVPDEPADPSSEQAPSPAEGGTSPHGEDAPPMEWKGKPFMVSTGKGKPQVEVRHCDDAESLRYWIKRIEEELDQGKVEKKFERYTIAKLDAMEYQLTRCAPW